MILFLVTIRHDQECEIIEFVDLLFPWHALSRISYVDQNAAAPPLPQQPPPTSWGHNLTDIEKFCWENFEKWPRIRLFYQIFKNLRKKKIFFGKNFV